VVVGQYRIIEKIADGGMGTVYKAEHTALEQIVALKALSPELSAHAEILDRFILEAKIQAKLTHRNVVNLYNFFEHNGSSYLVMEYTGGETLESIIKRTGPLPLDKSISIFEQVLNGIHYAHSRGIIHRDIKPINIMVTSDGTVKITDFGIAKIIGDFQKTQTGVKIGTLGYMSPEQVRGLPVTITTDIYSLGITFFQMVTGTIPFDGDSEYDIMQAILEHEPPSPRNYCQDISTECEALILKAISKSSSERFQSAKEFLDALSGVEICYKNDLLHSLPSSDTVKQHGIHVESPQNKRRSWLKFAALSILVLLIALYFLSNNIYRDNIQSSVSESSVTTHEVSTTTPQEYESNNSSAVKTPLPEWQKKNLVAESIKSGINFHNDGKYDQAIEVFQSVLNMEPDSKEASIGLEKAEKAKAALNRLTLGNQRFGTSEKSNAEKKAGIVSITSSPSVAEVFINGRYMGKTPNLFGNLPTGLSEIRIGHVEGYEDHIETVDIKPHEKISLDISLVNASPSKSESILTSESIKSYNQKIGYLYIKSDPDGAKIYADGTFQAVTPAQLKFTAGKHTIVLIKENYETYTEVLNTAEGIKPIQIRLRPK
jgi:serine/threonine protein kinase